MSLVDEYDRLCREKEELERELIRRRLVDSLFPLPTLYLIRNKHHADTKHVHSVENRDRL